MAGEWKETSRTRDGQPVPSADLGGFSQDSNGNVATLGAPVATRYAVRLDGSATPKRIDYVIAAATPVTRLGIYELNGDTLRICLARPGRERPAAFASPEGADLVLSTYTRVRR
jgi:uncharacterized protein (TIGR03067 family)